MDSQITKPRIIKFIPPILLLASLIALPTGCNSNVSSLGIFESSSDVGLVQYQGAANFDQNSNQYQITGSGENIWGQKDAFQYLWKKTSGDLSLTANIRLAGNAKNEHRKAGWMIRQTLDPDSPYVDAVLHGDGLVCMQFRKTKGGQTEEIKSPITHTPFIRLNRHANVFSLEVSADGKLYQPIGSLSIPLQNPVYAGLIVCSHDNSETETAFFSSVDMKETGEHQMHERIIESTLETISIKTAQRKFVYRSPTHFEAPNWSRDGKHLIFNSNGLLYKIPLSGSTPVQIETGSAEKCNNDHGCSPDGKLLAISDHQKGDSLIYILPADGGHPKQITDLGPSYWHGWSPDGKTLAYCAERNGQYDIYTIPVTGGKETQLTNTKGLDDGPDYSPDGKHIYFNSDRTGAMRIWKMNTDGTDQTQITNNDEYGDWFPHPSPDGKWIVFLSYDKNVKGHPPNKDVALRIMPASDGEPKILTTLFGGQGTINVPSWSPDSEQIAFVSYRLIAPN